MLLSNYENLTHLLLQPAVLIDASSHILDINKEAISYFNIVSDTALNLKLSEFTSDAIGLALDKVNCSKASVELTLPNSSGITSTWVIIPAGYSKIKPYLLICKEKITDVAKAQDNALQVIEELSELMPGNFYWKNSQGVYLGCNSSLIKTLGFSGKYEIVGKTDYDLWPDQADELRKNDLYVMRTGNPFEREEVALLADASMGYFSAIKVPLKSSTGRIVGIIGNSLDVTAEKRKLEMELEKQKLENAILEANAKAQAQEEIQKAILTFTGTMSHDLRTPLSTIQLIISVLDKSLPTLLVVYNQTKEVNEDIPYLNDQRIALLEDSCKNIMNATKQADSYIDATLKIIKGVATGSELLKPEDLVLCSIEEIIRRVLRDYPFKEGEADKLHSDTLQSFMFSGNSIFMARILQNLIKNAFEQIQLKAKGEIFICCEEGGSFNLLKIKDTAGSVSPPVIEKLFEGLHSSKKGGTGLGLSSAKLIMQAFGGDISCELVEGDCIEFVLSFPKV